MERGNDEALARLPSAAAVAKVVGAVAPTKDHASLAAALSGAFPPLRFTAADSDITWFASEKHLRAADLSLVAETFEPWLAAELARHGNDAGAVWTAWKDHGLFLTETEGRSIFCSAP